MCGWAFGCLDVCRKKKTSAYAGKRHTVSLYTGQAAPSNASPKQQQLSVPVSALGQRAAQTFRCVTCRVLLPAAVSRLGCGLRMRVLAASIGGLF